MHLSVRNNMLTEYRLVMLIYYWGWLPHFLHLHASFILMTFRCIKYTIVPNKLLIIKGITTKVTDTFRKVTSSNNNTICCKPNWISATWYLHFCCSYFDCFDFQILTFPLTFDTSVKCKVDHNRNNSFSCNFCNFCISSEICTRLAVWRYKFY